MKIQEIFNLILESNVGSHSGAGVIFFDGESVLMLKDNTSRWSFPGGKPIEGETPEETAKRESFEEVGSCPGNIIDFIKFENDNRIFYSYFSKVKDKFDVTISDEHVCFEWVPYQTLDKIPLKRYIRKNLNSIFKKLTLIKNNCNI
jgi:8-oxo-dGTP pyrophosphatase MutT (NUDIX family)